MALPSTGPLKFSDIYIELYGSHNNEAISLRSMSNAAGFTTPDSVSEFRGYTSKGLNVNPTVITGVTFRGGNGIESFDVISTSVNWTASATTNPDSFITIQSGDESGGDGTTTVDLNFIANTNTSSTRYGEITVSDNDTTDPAPDVIVQITQNKKYYFSTTSTFELTSTANSSDSVTISTNVSDWTASVNTNFTDNSLSVTASGNTITVTVSTANPGGSPRNGDIKVHDNSNADPADDLIIDVSQEGSQNITVNPDSFTGVSWKGGTVTTTVDATNTSWDYSKVSWITSVTPNNGTAGSTDVDIVVDDYTNTSTDRHDAAAVIISSTDDTINKNISITQNYKRYITASNKTITKDTTSFTVQIGGNTGTDWTVDTYSQTFITGWTQTDANTLTVDCNASSSIDNEQDTITLKDANTTDPADSITITITQEHVTHNLVIHTTKVESSSAGNLTCTSVAISSNLPKSYITVTITNNSCSGPCVIYQLKESNGETNSISIGTAVQNNTTVSTHVVTLTDNTDSSITDSFTVYRYPSESATVNPTSKIVYGSSADNYFIMNVVSNVPWTIGFTYVSGDAFLTYAVPQSGDPTDSNGIDVSIYFYDAQNSGKGDVTVSSLYSGCGDSNVLATCNVSYYP